MQQLSKAELMLSEAHQDGVKVQKIEIEVQFQSSKNFCYPGKDL
jgi:hypothetical protein